jgi:cell division protein FtsI/penicillin-binding protein 2
MDAKSKESVNCIGRRGFLRSLFGLTTVVEGRLAESAEAAEARATTQQNARLTGEWFWTNIRTGQIGFPSGLAMRQHRPGSVMKVVATAALLEENLVNPNETVDCTGSFTSKTHKVFCQVAHGPVNLEHALGKSCNVFFATMSSRLNGHVFGRYAKGFGLDAPIAKTPSGSFPETFHDDSLDYVLGLAEDLKPSALQLMRLSSIVATKGNVPHMHSAEAFEENQPPFKLELSAPTWKHVAAGMKLCVHEGTARQLDPEDKLHIAAKTGSVHHGKQFQSWITGYFPFESPEHAFCIWSPVGTSQDAAVPYAKKVLLSTNW